MSIDAWATVITAIGVMICGGLVHGVWILSSIKTDLHNFQGFTVESKADRAELWKRNHEHATKLGEHGERITVVETHVGMTVAKTRKAGGQ